MKAIIVHNPNDEYLRCLIPVDNINCITEYIENNKFSTKIWLKNPVEGEVEVSVAESLDEIYEMINDSMAER